VPTRDGAVERAPAGAAVPAPVPYRDPPVLRVVAGALIAVAAVALTVLECFLVPLRIGSVPVPVAVPLAMAGNVLLPRLAARQTGALAGVVLPPVLWLVVVIVLSVPRAEGDLIVPGSVTGLVFLFAGAVAGAYGVAAEIGRRARSASSGR
jgi:hypothetical protein